MTPGTDLTDKQTNRYRYESEKVSLRSDQKRDTRWPRAWAVAYRAEAEPCAAWRRRRSARIVDGVTLAMAVCSLFIEQPGPDVVPPAPEAITQPRPLGNSTPKAGLKTALNHTSA